MFRALKLINVQQCSVDLLQPHDAFAAARGAEMEPQGEATTKTRNRITIG
jgi:hypothetical protein